MTWKMGMSFRDMAMSEIVKLDMVIQMTVVVVTVT